MMKSNMRTLLFLSTLCFLFTSCKAKDPESNEKFGLYLSEMANQGKFNGNALILKNGEIVYQGAFGLRSIDPVDSLQLNSTFRLASVSKQFTAMAIMMLQEEGKLSYEQDIREVIPELPYEGITIRHLLCHQSGLPDYVELLHKNWKPNLKENDPNRFISGNDDIIKMLVAKKPPARFSPGEKFEYSNTGYVLLASIIIRVSGQPFEEFLKKRIFDPVGMTNTCVYPYRPDPDPNMPNRVFGFYTKRNGVGFGSSDCNFLNFAQGDGGIFSTIGDLLKWDRMLYENKLVSESTLNEAFTPGSLNNGKSTNYGFGWFIGKTKSGKKSVSHSGGWVGFMTHIEREIEENNCIIILTNNSAGKNFGMVKDSLLRMLHE